jgi:hypothetical protein
MTPISAGAREPELAKCEDHASSAQVIIAETYADMPWFPPRDADRWRSGPGWRWRCTSRPANPRAGRIPQRHEWFASILVEALNLVSHTKGDTYLGAKYARNAASRKVTGRRRCARSTPTAHPMSQSWPARHAAAPLAQVCGNNASEPALSGLLETEAQRWLGVQLLRHRFRQPL